MANYGDNQNFWDGQGQSQNQDFNFEMPDQFGQELNFQTFDNAAQAPTAPANDHNLYANVPPTQYGGSFLDTSQTASAGLYGQGDFDQAKSYTGNEFDDEPPLLEELGINPQHIIQKTLSVLNPFRATDKSIFEDTDLAGPLVFCLAFGGFLLLSGRVSFSYIYGIGVLGSLAFYCLLSLMATCNVTLPSVFSVLGYCLLPMVVLSGINVLITIKGLIGTVLCGLTILWCAVSASKLFVTSLSMDHQQILIAYPAALFYGVFALITIF